MTTIGNLLEAYFGVIIKELLSTSEHNMKSLLSEPLKCQQASYIIFIAEAKPAWQFNFSPSSPSSSIPRPSCSGRSALLCRWRCLVHKLWWWGRRSMWEGELLWKMWFTTILIFCCTTHPRMSGAICLDMVHVIYLNNYDAPNFLVILLLCSGYPCKVHRKI